MKKITFSCLFVLFALMLAGTFSVEAKGRKAKAISGKVNLNTATAAQIDLLPGISPQKAKAVIDYRSQKNFSKIEELDEVKGFTPKNIEKLKPYLSVEGPNTLKVAGGHKAKRGKRSRTS